MIPLFAVMGHPNEGKSSVVATLTEDASVPMSPIPGETTVCREYALRDRDTTLIRFVDTPGFQNPIYLRDWFTGYEGDGNRIAAAFREAHVGQERFQHDCELMKPLASQAGILFVVDGSRPLRPEDEAEMEVLRLTGLPRMAVINQKTGDRRFEEEWRQAFARSFNLVRVFDAHGVSFEERVGLMLALRSLEQSWEAAVGRAVEAIRTEQNLRIHSVALECESLVVECMQAQVAVLFDEDLSEEGSATALFESYQKELRALERRAHARIRMQFLHDRMGKGFDDVELVSDDLFSERVWSVLGLEKKQFVLGSVTAGAAAGAGADVAAGGLSFGVFTLGGAVAGGLGAVLGGKRLAGAGIRLPGPFGKLRFGRDELVMGPSRNPQLAFVLLDRCLLYAQILMNWPHARLDPHAFTETLRGRQQFASSWSDEERALVLNWLKRLMRKKETPPANGPLVALLEGKLSVSPAGN